jgi:RNase P subunit RPR2
MCPKCSADKWTGPKFAVVIGGEALVYTCMNCGYRRLDPTHDTKKARTGVDEELRKAFVGIR